MEKREISKKICLLGDSSVGKTSLIRRYVYDMFSDQYIVTFGAKVSSKEMRLYTDDEEYDLSLAIWDIVGEHDRRFLQAAHYKGSSGALVVCDCTRKVTFDNIEDWVDALLQSASGAKIVFLLNKIDLKDRAAVGLDDYKYLISKYKADCHETSAKTGENVEQAFKTLAEKMIFSK